MSVELAKSYDFSAVQADVLATWEAERCFHAEPTDPGEPYSIVIPPPNVTAALHLGHALNNTVQDILIRRARMQGKNAVWLPGTDHAGIATQTVVEKRVLKEEGKRRTDFARDEFVKKIQAWKDEYEQVILGQLKAMGCSCDWERTAFTMDEPRARAVREAFFQLFKAGLIYRGKRLVNWDPVTQTALADDEVEMEDVDGFFYYLKYPLCDANGGLTSVSGADHITVATTRPETMLGDTAVAINPTDPRAAELKGKFVKLPIIGRIIPIVEDDYVVKPVQFGGDPDDVKAQMATGFLKVTPAHDPNDYDIGRRHNLPVINVMAPDASISDKHGWTDVGEAGFTLGLSREAAREAIVEWFRRHDLLGEVKPYRHAVGHSYRSHAAIEPYLSDQWYCKVTDDRLAGAALRAMNPSQRTDRNEPRPSGSDSLTYFITFTTYGQHLHGHAEGSADRAHNIPGTPYLPPDAETEKSAEDQLQSKPYSLASSEERKAVQEAISEVCEHRGWRLLVMHVRTTHVHIVLEADALPEKVMNDFKSYATRKLRERGMVSPDARLWTRHGSTRYLNYPKSIEAARNYIVDEQGALLEPAPFDVTTETLWDGRSSSQKLLTFYPERYAKTYQTWHENIRDWCISRQLWWGHRIPVWYFQWDGPITDEASDSQTVRLELPYLSKEQNQHIAVQVLPGREGNKFLVAFCVMPGNQEIEKAIEENGGKRDPDVLDTWFSSGLWPLSTLDWPEDASSRAATVRERSAGSSENRSLTVAARGERASPLERWNPTSVLCTAREIITLWVSRMVMFNEFFKGQIPFKHVFIHAMIQDGEGRKMSKSLGNGVDPLDIIASHGADAMRYTLASMTTHTQDVRLPVERDPTSGKNTSPKFDLGRNFANKIWNAARFVMMQIEGVELPKTVDEASLSLADRWVLSKFAKAVAEADSAIDGYRFDQYAKTLYDFFWRDLCDWYVEAAKPQMKDDSRRGSTALVLASLLDASLRLLHPAVPFVTEKIWWELNRVCPQRGIPGWIDCPPAKRAIKAAWPTATRTDEPAEAAFTTLQNLIVAIRTLRNDFKVEPRKTVDVAVRIDAATAGVIESNRAVIETLAVCRLTAAGANVTASAEAAKATFAGGEVFVEGVVDKAAEQQRSAKREEELSKKIAGLNGRLANVSYTAKAPAHLVEQTRKELADAEAELAALRG
jgi:valyl-tRNA synthetase